MSSIANPYSCKPCSVVAHKLSPEFIDDALNGRIKWKGLFKRGSHRSARRQFGTDLEGFIRSRLNKRTLAKRIVIEEEEGEEGKEEEEEEGVELSSAQEEEEKRDADYVEPVPMGRQLRERRKRNQLVTCKDCSFSTLDKDSLLLHIQNTHRSVCKECNLSFENKFKYQLHVYETHKPPVELKMFTVYGCKVCQHFFDLEEDVHNHLGSHADIIEGGKYACALCRSTFAKENSLNSHLVNKHITYKCTFCDFLGTSFDILERHSLNTHAAYGKPYPCNLCDFRSATFGALTLHRNHNHALEYDKDKERCRLCFTHLDSDREIILEHLISHVDQCLITCTTCDYRCNSFQGMRNHGLDFHGLADLDLFAQLIDLNVLTKSVKAILEIQYGSKSKKGTRSQPTCTETNMAIEGLNASGFMGLEPIMDSPVKVVPMESSALNIQGVMADQDPFLGGYSVLHTPMDPMISFSNSVQIEDPDQNDYLNSLNGYPMQEYSSQTDQMSGLQNPQDDHDHSDPQTSVTVHPTCDPLSMAFESTVQQHQQYTQMSSQIPLPSEGILSVDPETGQLFLQGIPVFDEKGQAIYVAMHEVTQPQVDLESPTKGVKDCVQTCNEESAEPVPNGDVS